MNPIAISYARFSSAGQSEGESLARQIREADAYAEAHGLTISREHTFRDLGVSAFDQSNIRKGALGLFLRAVEEGKIPIGSTLIVESFDRLSRAKPLDALGVFTDILNAGLRIVTLTRPPKEFSRDSIDQNVFQLMEALLDMYRAHGESERKSQLVSSRWKSKREQAKASGIVMTAKAPSWIDITVNHDLHRDHPERRVAKLNPERATVALRIIEMAEQGIGNHTIIRTLHAENVAPWSQRIKRRSKADGQPTARSMAPKWEPSYIQKLLTNPALFGGIQLDDDIREDYYPALIDRARFDRLQVLRSARATTKNTNRKGKTVTNLFSGLLKCGYCGSSMNVAGYKSRVSGYERKYVACHGARIGSTDCKMRMWFIDELEPSLLFWLTQVDYQKLLGVSERTDKDTQQELLAMYEAKVKTLTTRIENGHEAILDGMSSMRSKVKEMELELASTEKLLEAQRRKVAVQDAQAGIGASRMKAVVLLFKALKDTTDDVERRALREQLSAAINQVVEHIQMYPTGHTLTGDKEDRFIDVLFKNGAQRRIEPGEC
jgi:DNA invertase Pin-like site-specific DNA recombinase